MTKASRTLSRRSFLKTCTALAASTGLPLWFVERVMAETAPARKPLSPNDRPSFALIGSGGMGKADAGAFKRFADLVALCDVDSVRLDEAYKNLATNGASPVKYRDFRKVLERKDIDMVVVATPDHWHTLVNMAAARAGKDIYSEKPLTLTIDEGRRLVNVVNETGCVLQTGSQQRSTGKFRMACELVRNGRIGKLQSIDVWLPAGPREGSFKASAVPGTLDWNYWLGQAPKVDYVRQRCHGTFRYWLDYSGGTLTDWGAHHNDIARWAVGLDGPVEIEGKAQNQPIPGGYNALSKYEVKLTYANGVTQFVRSTLGDNGYGGIVEKDGQRNGIKFVGNDGWIWINRAGIDASREDTILEPLPDTAERLYMSRDHRGNLIDCMRTRAKPIADVETGHRSATVCHLCVIAIRTGKKLTWNPEKERFTGAGADEANSYVSREMRKPYDYSFVS